MDPVITRLEAIREANRCAAGVNDWSTLIDYAGSREAHIRKAAGLLINGRRLRYIHAQRGEAPGATVAWHINEAEAYRRKI